MPDHAVVLGGNANRILVTIGITDYVFSRTAPQKIATDLLAQSAKKRDQLSAVSAQLLD